MPQRPIAEEAMPLETIPCHPHSQSSNDRYLDQHVHYQTEYASNEQRLWKVLARFLIFGPIHRYDLPTAGAPLGDDDQTQHHHDVVPIPGPAGWYPGRTDVLRMKIAG